MIDNDSNLIKNKLEIYNLLKKVQKSKQLISLSFDSLPQYCLTSLLEVHYDAEVLIFDEPNPQVSSSQIDSKKEAEFSLKLDHLPVIFKSTFILKNKNNKNDDIYTLFPKKIFYPQHRDYYRFRTEFINDIDTTIFLSATNRLPCQLINISLNGVCLRFPYSFASMFQVDQLIDDIYIKLPEQTGFSVSAKVQNTRIENNYSHIAVGLQISEQKPRIEKAIQQFIFHSEHI